MLIQKMSRSYPTNTTPYGSVRSVRSRTESTASERLNLSRVVSPIVTSGSSDEENIINPYNYTRVSANQGITHGATRKLHVQNNYNIQEDGGFVMKSLQDPLINRRSTNDSGLGLGSDASSRYSSNSESSTNVDLQTRANIMNFIDNHPLSNQPRTKARTTDRRYKIGFPLPTHSPYEGHPSKIISLNQSNQGTQSNQVTSPISLTSPISRIKPSPSYKSLPKSSMNEKKPYICDFKDPVTNKVCGKAFAQPRYLSTHKNIHKEDSQRKWFECKLCVKTYKVYDPELGKEVEKKGFLRLTSDRNLKAHQRNVHETREKTWECPHAGCNKKYKYESELLKHKRSHPEFVHLVGEGWTCPGCQQKFTHYGNFTKHLKVNIHKCPNVDRDRCREMLKENPVCFKGSQGNQGSAEAGPSVRKDPPRIPMIQDRLNIGITTRRNHSNITYGLTGPRINLQKSNVISQQNPFQVPRLPLKFEAKAQSLNQSLPLNQNPNPAINQAPNTAPSGGVGAQLNYINPESFNESLSDSLTHSLQSPNLNCVGIFKGTDNKNHIVVVAEPQPNKKPPNYSTEPYSHPIELFAEPDDDYLENLNYRIIKVPENYVVGDGKGNNFNNFDDSSRTSALQVKPRNVRKRPKPPPGRKPTFGVDSKGISSTIPITIEKRQQSPPLPEVDTPDQSISMTEITSKNDVDPIKTMSKSSQIRPIKKAQRLRSKSEFSLESPGIPVKNNSLFDDVDVGCLFPKSRKLTKFLPKKAIQPINLDSYLPTPVKQPLPTKPFNTEPKLVGPCNTTEYEKQPELLLEKKPNSKEEKYENRLKNQTQNQVNQLQFEKRLGLHAIDSKNDKLESGVSLEYDDTELIIDESKSSEYRHKKFDCHKIRLPTEAYDSKLKLKTL